MAQLGAPDTGEGLAGRTADQYVHLLIDGTADAQIAEYGGGVFLGDIAGLVMGLTILSMANRCEVCPMRLRGPRVEFDRGDKFKSGRSKSKGNSATSSE